jgi:hypothetical protein
MNLPTLRRLAEAVQHAESSGRFALFEQKELERAANPQTILAMIAAIEEMREGLNYYAEKERYSSQCVSLSCGCCSDTKDPEVFDDCGLKARATLARVEKIFNGGDAK